MRHPHRFAQGYGRRAPFALSGLVALAGACGSEGASGDAELTIVGDATFAAGAGAQPELVVGYHGADGAPLFGEVEFVLAAGADAGASLSDDVVETDEIGAASVILDTAGAEDADVEVRAEAEGAEPAVWEIAVGEAPPVDPTGVYALRSEIDLTAGLPGIVGDAVGLVVDLTDDSADPTLWLVERVIDRLGLDIDPPYTLIRAVNSLILDFAAPAIANTLIDLGEDFGAMTTRFGIVTELEVRGEPGDRTATHELKGFVIRYSGDEYEFDAEEAGIEPVEIEGVEVSFDPSHRRFEIAEHELPVSYGTLAILVLEQVLLSGVGGDIEDLLLDGIDCDLLAEEIAERTGRGSNTESAIATACPIVLSETADRVTDRLTDVDRAGVVLALAGEAEASYGDDGAVVDRFDDGTWEGEIRVVEVDEATPLSSEDSTFAGERADRE